MKSGHMTSLKKTGLKETPPRILILDIFSHTSKPLDAETIINALKGKKINSVTVYRTLDTFQKAGIIRTVDLRKNSVFYELAEDHHHHIVCTSCGAIEDFEDCAAEDISARVLRGSKKFKTIKDHSLEFFGICRSCV